MCPDLVMLMFLSHSCSCNEKCIYSEFEKHCSVYLENWVRQMQKDCDNIKTSYHLTLALCVSKIKNIIIKASWRQWQSLEFALFSVWIHPPCPVKCCVSSKTSLLFNLLFLQISWVVSIWNKAALYHPLIGIHILMSWCTIMIVVIL